MTQAPSVALATETNEEEAHYIRHALQTTLPVRTVSGTLQEIAKDDLSDVTVLMPFIHSKIGPAELEMLPALKLIATRSTGYDHIDLQAATERGIAVANVPGYGETAVAEFTFALLLTISRKVNEALHRTRGGDYTLEGLRGFDLYGKTIGVVGAGAIGLRVIRIAAGFGMRVLAYDM